MKKFFIIAFVLLVLLASILNSPAPSSGGSSGGGTGTGLTPSQLAKLNAAVTNLNGTSSSEAFLTSETVSNSTYGELVFQKNAVSPNGLQVDTFNSARFFLPQNKTLHFYNNGGGGAPVSYVNAWGDTAYDLFGFRVQDARTGGAIPAFNFYSWGDPSIFYFSGYRGMPVTTYSPYMGGSIATAENAASDPKELSIAMTVPPVIVTTWIGDTLHNTNEMAVTNIAAIVANSGILDAITNAGGTVWLHMDANTRFMNPTRDANLNISMNTVLFPDGTNVASIVHGYGLKLMGTMYGYPYPTNLALVNSLGVLTSSSDYQAQPAMSPNTIAADIAKFYDFGFDGIRFADANAGLGYYQLFAQSIAANSLSPMTTGLRLPYSQGNGRKLSRPLAIEFLTVGPGYTPTSVYRHCNLIGTDSGATTWPGHVTSSIPFVQAMDAFRGHYLLEATFRDVGHYGAYELWANNADQAPYIWREYFTQSAINLERPMFGFDTLVSTPQATFPNFINCLTNKTYLRIYLDKLCKRPYVIFDNGATNTSGWYRQLDGGEYAVGIFNESAGTSNVVVNFSALGASTNSIFKVTSAWDGNLNKGNFVGSYTHSLTGTTSALLLLTPAVGYTTNVPVSGVGTLCFTNGVLLNITP